MKRILTICMLATATFLAASCGNSENKTGSNSDSVLNSPPAAGTTADSTTTPGMSVDSTGRDSIHRDTTAIPR